MQDKTIFGSITGIAGGFAGLLFSYTMFLLGISPISSINVAASLVVIDVVNLTLGGII